MYKRYLLAFFILFISIGLKAQLGKTSTQLFYMRMEGKIGKDMNVVANLERQGSKVEGNYAFFRNEPDSSHQYDHLTDVFGHISTQNKVTLKELQQDKDVFTGILKDVRFTGQWDGPEDKKQYFFLHENYPVGSIPMEVHYLHSEQTLEAGNPKAPHAQIELSLLVPKKQSIMAPALDSINKSIQNTFFGDIFPSENPDSLLFRFEAEFYNQFNAQNKYWKTSPSNAFNWQRNVDMSVVFNSDGLLCLEYLRHGYSGSGHSISRISYLIFDLKSGKTLTYKDFFNPRSLARLSNLLTEKLKQDYQVSDDSLSLKNAGFYVNKVMPNGNIYLGGDGIGFVYNNYELAPPSKGIIDLFLKKDEIKELLLPGTILSSHRQ